MNVRASVWKTICNGGKYITSICPRTDKETASKNTLFVKNPTLKILLVWERQLKALNISKNTKQVNVIVVSRGVIPSELI